ncbi:uncharacterized protein LOC100203424 isoform X1 [Hydra vulgaris]|uniref:uncharacterized protein LOC100203424 isoform X1 n=1 Tax=Hydra vulgaris TaxID=6087 RepID=UPI001F5F1468|nr:uncharacterized protein LOC100203424 isoform X1 [Hydra vulgaris]
MSSSSSDEDDEEARRIRESVNGFEIAKQLSDHVRENKSKNYKDSESKRASKEDNEDINILKITPEVQKFVSIKLSSYLDKTLKEKIFDQSKSNAPNQIQKSEGIHLFSHSIMIPDDFDEKPVKKHQKIKRKRLSSSEDEESLEKFQSVAVTIESIMKDACEYVKRDEKPILKNGRK